MKAPQRPGSVGSEISQSGELWEFFTESLLASITEGIVVSRHEDGIPWVVLANNGAERALGVQKDALLGTDARDLYVADEHTRLQRLLLKAIFRAAHSPTGWAELPPMQSRMRRLDSVTLPVSISYKVLVNRQFVPPRIYVIGIARDISQSERAEQKFRKLLELLDALDVAYFQADEAGRTMDPTETESRITGHPIEELQGFDRKKLYGDPAERERLIERVRANGGRLTLAVERIVRKNGESIWVEGGLRTPKEGGLEGIYRDVTDRILLQGFLDLPTNEVVGDRTLYERIEQTARFDLNYLTSLGHQLQTPLGALVETLRRFEQGDLSREKIFQLLPYVIGQALFCSRLVKNLSFLDQILRGERFKSERVSLAKLAGETAIDFRHLLRERNLDLEIHHDELRRHLVVDGHREMLRQVLVNLVDNAIKYSRSGTVIRIRGFEWPRGRVCEVSNEGLRLATDEEEKIFERGFRTRQAKLIAAGTGFGLWLVRKILAAHDATIRCSQEIEEERTRVVFRITFPHSRNPSPNRRVS